MRRKGKKNTQIDDKLIDEVIRMSYGFSEEQIRAEMEDALAHPDNSPELKAPDDEFQQILQKMKERGITPRISEDGDKDEGHPAVERGRTRLSSRRFRRLLLAAAVLGVIGIGFSLNAVGKSATEYRIIDGENNIVWNNIRSRDDVKDVTEAYERLEAKLSIPSIQLGYMSESLVFERLVLSENYGTIRFKSNENSFKICEQKIKPNEYGIQGSDQRQIVETVYNPWLNRELKIYEEVSSDGKIRYCINIGIDEAIYTIIGDIDKGDFLKIAKGLYFNN